MIWIFYPMASHGCVEEITDVWDESHILLLTRHHAVKVINNMERPVIIRHILRFELRFNSNSYNTSK